MTVALFSNNAVSSLASSISSGATSISLATGTGSLFPSPGSNQYFALVLTPLATPNGPPREIVYCTARSVDTLTVVRGQEGTSATTWTAGDNAQLLITAGTLSSLAPLDSPALINSPTAPTATPLSNNTLLATTAYCDNAVSASASPIISRQAVFTTSGTWTVPPGVTTVWATGCGGGGGGGGGVGSGTGGGGGGGAQAVLKQALTVVPGTVETVTVGAGGTAGSTSGAGGAGGTTSFGSLLSLAGGGAGLHSGGGAGAAGGTGGVAGIAGQFDSHGISFGGAGGGSLFGGGGSCGQSTGVGQNASGYGAGGGGGSTGAAGTGAGGLLMLEW